MSIYGSYTSNLTALKSRNNASKMIWWSAPLKTLDMHLIFNYLSLSDVTDLRMNI